MLTTNLKSLSNLSPELRDKDFFSMGYPYYICLYSEYVTFSTDYGVLLLKYDHPKLLMI